MVFVDAQRDGLDYKTTQTNEPNPAFLLIEFSSGMLHNVVLHSYHKMSLLFLHRAAHPRVEHEIVATSCSKYADYIVQHS